MAATVLFLGPGTISDVVLVISLITLTQCTMTDSGYWSCPIGNIIIGIKLTLVFVIIVVLVLVFIRTTVQLSRKVNRSRSTTCVCIYIYIYSSYILLKLNPTCCMYFCHCLVCIYNIVSSLSVTSTRTRSDARTWLFSGLRLCRLCRRHLWRSPWQRLCRFPRTSWPPWQKWRSKAWSKLPWLRISSEI